MTSESTLKLRWPVVLSFLTCAFAPATTAKRMIRVSLPSAFLIHFVAATFGSCLIVVASDSAHQFVANVIWLVDELVRNPSTVVPIILGIVILIEVAFLGLAFLMMSWGAVDEPLRASFSHAIRRVWCQTPHATLIILAVALLTGYLDGLDATWTLVHPLNYPPQPGPIVVPPNVVPAIPNTPAWTAHIDEVHRIEREARMAKPWYLRYEEAIAVDFGFLCGIWFLGAMLRAVGVPRSGPPMPRQPRCDACGYDLTLMPMDGRCPECGEPVAASLGPGARPGTPWTLRQVPAVIAWWRTIHTAVFQPVVLGRMLSLQSPGTAHRRFFLLHMLIIFFIGAASVPILYYVVEGKTPWPNDLEIVLIGSPVFGTLCMVGALIVSLNSAGLWGIHHQYKDKRNLLSGAVQVVSYLVVYLVTWQVFGAATGIGAVALGRSAWFEQFTLSRRAGPEALAFFLWFIPNLACGLVYWTLVKKAVAATRFANR